MCKIKKKVQNIQEDKINQFNIRVLKFPDKKEGEKKKQDRRNI